jgi:NAD(P)-dependent dehydrogenase (short-subunit alcohol dehydrogenase family)
MGALDGKAVVVTGSGRGIGAAYARHAAGEGARVVVSDVVPGSAEGVAASIVEAGGTAVAHPADVTRWDEVEALVDRCVQEFGAIDGMVCNAGILTMSRVEEMDEPTLRRVVEINLLGTAFCGTHAARRMLERGRGSIVNVTSGTHMGQATFGAYGATKGGIASFTYAWAADLAGSGVRVNAISPMATGAMNAVGVEYLSRKGITRPVSPPMPEPEVNAPVVTFLLSDAAEGVNGQVVRIDGSRLSLLAHPSVMAPTLVRDRWELADVQAAFEAHLFAQQVPLGVVSTRTTVVPEELQEFPGS